MTYLKFDEYTLVPLKLTHAAWFNELRNSIALNLNSVEMYSLDNCKTWIEKIDKSSTSKRFVVENTEATAIGVFRIDAIDFLNSNCCVGMDISPNFRRRGIAKKTYNCVLDWLFNQYNMHSVWLEVLESNEIARTLYSKLGFKECGRKREGIYRNGKYEDCIIMDLLKQEWNENIHRGLST